MNGKAQAALRSGCREDRRSAAGRGRFHGHGVDGRSSHGAGFGAGRHIGLHDAASQFFKSMTTHVSSRVWQDVYYVNTPNCKVAYVKVTLRTDGSVVIQFKEK